MNIPHDPPDHDPRQLPPATAPPAIVVQLFAGMAAAAGRSQLTVQPTVATVAGVRVALAAAIPAIEPLLLRSAVAVDGRYAAAETSVGPDSEVAVIPPVSGG